VKFFLPDLVMISSVLSVISAPMAHADIVWDYTFNGTVAPGTIDSSGRFGPAGANLGGDLFAVSVYVDRTIGYTLPANGGTEYMGGPGVFNTDGPIPVPVPSPLLGSTFTVNGRSVGGPSGGVVDIVVSPDSFYSFSTAAANFNATLTGTTSFPIYGTPGFYDLSCRFQCGSIFSQSFQATAGIALGSDLNNLTITETTAPVPLPAAAWLMLSALGGLGLVTRNRGRPAA
jgi:hypothetical protein